MDCQTANFLDVQEFYEAGVDVVVKCVVDTSQYLHLPDAIAIFRNGVIDLKDYENMVLIDRKNVVDNIATIRFDWKDFEYDFSWKQKYVFIYIKYSTQIPVAVSQPFRFQKSNELQCSSYLTNGNTNKKKLNRHSMLVEQWELIQKKLEDDLYAKRSEPQAVNPQGANANVSTYRADSGQNNGMLAMMSSNRSAEVQMIENVMCSDPIPTDNTGNPCGFMADLITNVTDAKHLVAEVMSSFDGVSHDGNAEDHGKLTDVISKLHDSEDLTGNVMSGVTGTSQGGNSESQQGLVLDLISKLAGAKNVALEALSMFSDSAPIGSSEKHQKMNDLFSKLIALDVVTEKIMGSFTGSVVGENQNDILQNLPSEVPDVDEQFRNQNCISPTAPSVNTINSPYVTLSSVLGVPMTNTMAVPLISTEHDDDAEVHDQHYKEILERELDQVKQKIRDQRNFMQSMTNIHEAVTVSTDEQEHLERVAQQKPYFGYSASVCDANGSEMGTAGDKNYTFETLRNKLVESDDESEQIPKPKPALDSVRQLEISVHPSEKPKPKQTGENNSNKRIGSENMKIADIYYKKEEMGNPGDTNYTFETLRKQLPESDEQPKQVPKPQPVVDSVRQLEMSVHLSEKPKQTGENNSNNRIGSENTKIADIYYKKEQSTGDEQQENYEATSQQMIQLHGKAGATRQHMNKLEHDAEAQLPDAPPTGTMCLGKRRSKWFFVKIVMFVAVIGLAIFVACHVY